MKEILKGKIVKRVGIFYSGLKKEFNKVMAYEKKDGKLLFIPQNPNKIIHNNVTGIYFHKKFMKIGYIYLRIQYITTGKQIPKGNIIISEETLEEIEYKYSYSPNKTYKIFFEIKFSGIGRFEIQNAILE